MSERQKLSGIETLMVLETTVRRSISGEHPSRVTPAMKRRISALLVEGLSADKGDALGSICRNDPPARARALGACGNYGN